MDKKIEPLRSIGSVKMMDKINEIIEVLNAKE